MNKANQEKRQVKKKHDKSRKRKQVNKIKKNKANQGKLRKDELYSKQRTSSGTIGWSNFAVFAIFEI